MIESEANGGPMEGGLIIWENLGSVNTEGVLRESFFVRPPCIPKGLKDHTTGYV